MSAHAISTATQVVPGTFKKVIATLTLSSSYDAGGSVLDLSTGGTLATNGFATVKGLHVLAVSALAGGIKHLCYIPGTGPNDGKVGVFLGSADPPAEDSGDLHTFTYVVEIVGT